MTHPLTSWGWTDRVASLWQAEAQPDWEPGRLVRAERDVCRVQTAAGEVLADRAPQKQAQPVVGDWVALKHGESYRGVFVAHVLPRHGVFARKAAGKRTREQRIATNVDTTLILTALDQDFSVRRIERYLTLAWEADTTPVVVLSKADLCDDVPARIAEAQAVSNGAAVLAVTGLHGEGVDALAPFLRPASTVVLLGSSGVGKSTLVNALSGSAAAAVGEVRSDGKGRHTTTQREMFQLPGGALLIDNPGMRELALWADEQAVERVFDDVERLASQCQFRDCRHDGEIGCAVRAAVAVGDLDAARLESFIRLRDEAAQLALRQDEHERRQHERRTMGRWRKDFKKHRKDR